jgi:hypothetical protein
MHLESLWETNMSPQSLMDDYQAPMEKQRILPV